MRTLYICGAGGLGRETAYLVERINGLSFAFQLAGFITEKPEDVGKKAGRLSVSAHDGELPEGFWSAAVAVGEPAVRRKIVEKLIAHGVNDFPTLVDPLALFDHRTVDFGEGSIVLPGATLTVDVTVGRFVLINPGVSISHDVTIGDYSLIGPGASIAGGVGIGESVVIGTGASLAPGVSIGDNAVVGAGAAVVRNVEPGVTVAGVPARPLSKGGRQP